MGTSVDRPFIVVLWPEAVGVVVLLCGHHKIEMLNVENFMEGGE